MTSWKTELDLLVEETLRYMKSVRVEPPMPRTILEPDRKPSVNWQASERDEITRRVASFRAHQQRFIREREDYAAAQWKRTRLDQTSVK